jgi:ABC-type uncharacterized transport system substrate-binding protein
MALVGMLLNLTELDRESKPRMDRFKKGSGLTDRDIKALYGDGDYDSFKLKAQQLVKLNPKVLFGTCGPSTWALDWARQDAGVVDKIPLVFAAIFDPASTAREVPPNATGYYSCDFSHCGKWAELLKAAARQVKRAAVIMDPGRPAGMAQLGALQAAAQQLGVKLKAIDVRNTGQLDKTIKDFADQGADGGLIVPGSGLTATLRKQIIALVAKDKHALPAIYPNSLYVRDGGLMSFGAITPDLYESGGVYVKRLLNNESISKLPVVPNYKYELCMNVATAGAFGIPVPDKLLEIPVDKV